MILPLGDFPNPRGVPYVNYAFISLNVGVFLLITLPLSATPVDTSDPLLAEYVRVITRRISDPAAVRQLLTHASFYDIFIFRYGFRATDPHVANLFYSLFLHAGFLHLAGNMLFLWIYGDNVEHRIGHGSYAFAYLTSGVFATLFHAWFDPGPLPLIGASGAISGVLGFYFIWFPHNQVRLLVLLIPFFYDIITLRARVLLGIYLVLDNLLPFLLTRASEVGGVAHGAHIGGFLAGLAGASWINRREMMRAPEEYVRHGHAVAGTSKDEVSRLLAAGRIAEAAHAYFQLPPDATRGILLPAESLRLAGWLRDNGQNRAALTVYRRQLRDHPNAPGAAEAHLGVGLLQVEVFGQTTAAYQHFLDALDLNPSPETAVRVRAALKMIDVDMRWSDGTQ